MPKITPPPQTPPLITRDLDFAAFLQSCGHLPIKHKALQIHESEFVFIPTPEILKLQKEFYMGEAHTNITNYIRQRRALKDAHAKQLHAQSEKRRKKALKITTNTPAENLTNGTPYWYKDQYGKTIKNLYADKEPHLSRLKQGNFYLTPPN